MTVKVNGFIVPEELMKLLLNLASKWGEILDEKTMKVSHLSGAMTNEVYRISWPMKTENLSRSVLVRIYGEGVDLFFNREDEIRTFECMSKHGQGPHLLGRFSVGRVEEFIHARTLSAGDLRDSEISALIAAKLREFHGLDMPGSKKVILWGRMRNWLSVAKNLCSAEHAKEFSLDTLEEEILNLEKELSTENQEIGFCHNDLQYGNVMIDEETKSITLIDYEYASYNPVAYDIANHFCEMAANYHTDTPHILNYDLYPSLEERRRFVQAYLNYPDNDDEEKSELVEELVKDVEKFTVANHVFWGLWGIISASVSNIEFDFMEYARQRFRQYRLRKHQLLGNSESNY
ncbi:probable choline kinase 2 [Impatiens glandulifera]|uniref:probable choline kinase 2 n=1 Tax=Impatiens glandulifera TaxID=253017 RepID=UPI001FB0A68D|nr:probable choline kinase 2 [Impatiens glandulifera]